MAIADEAYGSIDKDDGPVLMLGRTEDDWALIVVNERGQGVSFTITELPKALEGRTLYRLYSDESHKVKGGKFRDGIRGFGANASRSPGATEFSGAFG